MRCASVRNRELQDIAPDMNMLSRTNSRHPGRPNKITLRSVLRLTMPGWVLLYCAGFNWSYAEWLSPIWDIWPDLQIA